MRIERKASAGTMQSCDLIVQVEPLARLEVEVDSTVKKQFEPLIRERVSAVLARLGVESGLVRVSDRGALDYAIEARVEAAVRRAAEEE
jgi:citrate lyase subunit gamma (acyl carrier protein)